MVADGAAGAGGRVARLAQPAVFIDCPAAEAAALQHELCCQQKMPAIDASITRQQPATVSHA